MPMFKFPIRLSFRRSVTFPEGKLRKKRERVTRIFQEKRKIPRILYRVITNSGRSPIVITASWGTTFIPFYPNYRLHPRPKGTWEPWNLFGAFANCFLLGERRWISGSQLNLDCARDFRSTPVEHFHERIRARYSFTIRWGIAMDLLNTILVE